MEHRATASATAQNRHAVLPGAVEVGFGTRLVGVAEHEEMFARFPKAQDAAVAAVLLAQVEQRLVAGEVFGGRGQRQVEKLHGA